MTTLTLTQPEIASCLSTAEIDAWVEYVFREWGNERVVMPAKITLDMARSGTDSWSNAMPAFLVSERVAGIKWAGGYPANSAAGGLPYIMGLIVLTDVESGCTLAVMDGGLITTERTGASAAVAARHLANQPLTDVAIIGAGGQARSCLRYLHNIAPDATYRVADIDTAARKRFVAELRDSLRADVREADTDEAIGAAQLIVIVTTATDPFIRADWISSGATVLAMSSFQQTEDAFILGADKIITDGWEQSRHRGELERLAHAGRLDRAMIHTEIGAVVAGASSGRERAEERLLVSLVGLGAHDVYVAAQVYRQALARGLGTRVEL